MVDREHGHNERDFWNKASEGLGSFQELSGISNKTLVSLLIFGLIIILCVAKLVGRTHGISGDCS